MILGLKVFIHLESYNKKCKINSHDCLIIIPDTRPRTQPEACFWCRSYTELLVYRHQVIDFVISQRSYISLLARTWRQKVRKWSKMHNWRGADQKELWEIWSSICQFTNVATQFFVSNMSLMFDHGERKLSIELKSNYNTPYGVRIRPLKWSQAREEKVSAVRFNIHEFAHSDEPLPAVLFACPQPLVTGREKFCGGAFPLVVSEKCKKTLSYPNVQRKPWMLGWQLAKI